jgi:hypothetical protein
MDTYKIIALNQQRDKKDSVMLGGGWSVRRLWLARGEAGCLAMPCATASWAFATTVFSLFKQQGSTRYLTTASAAVQKKTFFLSFFYKST